MRKIGNLIAFCILIIATVILLTLVDCPGERPSLEQSGVQLPE